MTRSSTTWIAAGLALALCLGGYASRAQDNPNKPTKTDKPTKSDEATKTKRLAYFVKHGHAKDLAVSLSKHFKDAAEVQVLPESPANCLLINAPAATLEEIVKLLERLDKKPQTVSVEVLVAEVLPNKDAKPGEVIKEVDEKEFIGPFAEVLDRVEALRKKGILGSVKRIQMTALENQPASLLLGENKPYVAGVTVRGTGAVSKTIFYRNTGMQVKVTPRVAAEKRILLDLDIQDSRASVPADSPVLGKDEDGTTIRTTMFTLTKAQGEVAVNSGRALPVKGVKTESKAGPTQMLVIVSARLLEEPKPAK